MEGIERRWRELDHKDLLNQAERTKLENDAKEIQRQMKIVFLQQLKQQAEQSKLIEKHENEKQKLLADVQGTRASLEKLNMQFQYFQENMKTVETVKDLEWKLTQLQQEKEKHEELLRSLIPREEEERSELEKATRAAIEVLQARRQHKVIGVKRIGEINDAPWRQACMEKYKNDQGGWELRYSAMMAEWQALVYDPEWEPYIRVQDKDGLWKKQVDEQNEKLVQLQAELGKEVCATVIAALKELGNYGLNNRTPLVLPWNFRENRKATLEEVFKVLKGTI
ncbi:hypothetical protein O6H91_03G003400 [Diphasiastrum complanatum]|uniref:Uncharacterized protein n=5 Tax=Diphasiastrum complanatum TaxID=34168 RepID=A0ACC2E3B6_DIPCM|nr:hypothetical protein O6H91_03G003400 [Diphasiastrum complanatum]KAJ7560867.1 hypothetical protein O6H91_03G003400 [Diphasiastrum complanatum]KAJ7560868.1 hypothetical protein O6H91_03G003400 [Diphasiastrum complanatum]KAJ7560869.1 hypothetical protein O6H91_03G003400 [Diphasiastrum complanatum]KAJ7560870.1 hypothetical protein O6H91_03G003400 [Diphasiastrum complanatum]